VASTSWIIVARLIGARLEIKAIKPAWKPVACYVPPQMRSKYVDLFAGSMSLQTNK